MNTLDFKLEFSKTQMTTSFSIVGWLVDVFVDTKIALTRAMGEAFNVIFVI